MNPELVGVVVWRRADERPFVPTALYEHVHADHEIGATSGRILEGPFVAFAYVGELGLSIPEGWLPEDRVYVSYAVALPSVRPRRWWRRRR